MTTKLINDEVELFDAMFHEPKKRSNNKRTNKGTLKSNVKECLKILFVCSSGGYSDSSSQQVSGIKWREFKFNREAFPHVDQVILLYLDTPQHRFSFFGIEQNVTNQAVVEWIITASN